MSAHKTHMCTMSHALGSAGNFHSHLASVACRLCRKCTSLKTPTAYPHHLAGRPFRTFGTSTTPGTRCGWRMPRSGWRRLCCSWTPTRITPTRCSMHLLAVLHRALSCERKGSRPRRSSAQLQNSSVNQFDHQPVFLSCLDVGCFEVYRTELLGSCCSRSRC